MNRREALQIGAAALGGAGGTLAAVSVSARRSTAASELSLDIADDHAALDIDDDIASVWLDVSVEWSYELPDGSTPDTVVVEIAAGVDEPELVADTESAVLFNSADGSESFEVDLLAENVLSGESLIEAEEKEVQIEARLFVEGGGDVLAREIVSDTAALSVDVEELDVDEFGELSGSGSLEIETA